MDGPRKQSPGSRQPGKAPDLSVGASAAASEVRLRSFQLGAVPLLNRYLQRMRLSTLLQQHLPPDDVRQTIPTERIVLLLVRNVLLSREPLYGMPEWTARHAPELFDLFHQQIAELRDDRLGSWLARLFHGSTSELLLAVVRQAVDEWGVTLEELHNDSTTVSFYGLYAGARKPRRNRGRMQPAITWGHSQAQRPDWKQLLFTLTLANDGGVPLCFHVACGNTTADGTHRRSWDLLCQLVGNADFLYVADCKLASRENLQHIAARGGRFLTLLPATRGEDARFRQRLRANPLAVEWLPCWTRVEEPDDPSRPLKTNPDDVLRVCAQQEITTDGYRLLWFHSRRKAELDVAACGERCRRAIQELEQLQARLASPRTRFRERSAVRADRTGLAAGLGAVGGSGTALRSALGGSGGSLSRGPTDSTSHDAAHPGHVGTRALLPHPAAGPGRQPRTPAAVPRLDPRAATAAHSVRSCP